MGDVILWGGCTVVVSALLFCVRSILWTAVSRIAVCILFAGLFVLMYQIFLLIKDAYCAGWDWRGALVLAGLGNLSSPIYGGVSGIIHWLVELPIAIKLIVTGSFVSWVGMAGQVITSDSEAAVNSDRFDRVLARFRDVELFEAPKYNS